MKHPFRLLWLLFLAISLTGIGCVTAGDPIEEPTGMTLEVRVLQSGLAKKDAMVGLSSSPQNLRDKVYTHTARSDQNGIAKFTFLAAATYHYRAWFSEQGVEREVTGQVIVTEGNDEMVTLYF